MAVHIPDDSKDLRDHLDTRVWKHAHPIETLGQGTPHGRDFALYAMISTWYESDIVEAAVRNCFAHGCDRVYLVDNDSPDDTLERAVAAGAQMAMSYTTDFYRDELRVGLLNRLEKDITEKEKLPCVWWLTLDCDEFIQVPGREPLRSWLARLDPQCNCVGALAFDHYPTSKPENIPGYHPAVFQPYGMLRHLFVCAKRHWKHPLLRYEGGTWNICHTRGLHAPFTRDGVMLRGPSDGLLLHHFMFREEEFTRARLTALCQSNSDLGGASRSTVDDRRLGGEGAVKRFRNLDLIYSQQWDKAELCHAQAYAKTIGIPVRHWRSVLSEHAYSPLLWHGWEDAQQAAWRWNTQKGGTQAERLGPLDVENPLSLNKRKQEEAAGVQGLSLTQFLVFEICRACNLCQKHSAHCPSADQDRYGRLDTSNELTDEVIVQSIREARQMGFRGEIAWHYYNEPMLAWDRLRPLMATIRQQWPDQRFALWTNGTSFPADLSELAIFDDVWVSNYENKPWSTILGPHVKRLHVLNGQLDGRKRPAERASDASCLRPYNELIIDHYGNGHLCCADWRGEVWLGNVFRDGFAAVAAQYLGVRDTVRQKPLPSNAPAACRLCRVRQSHVGDLVTDVAEATRQALRRP